MNYTVIVPFYNEEKNVSSFNKQLINNLNKISGEKRNLEIIYIDDGSNDKTFEELTKLKTNIFETLIIKHRNNLSQSAAINTGILQSKYENIIIMDGDLQNDPDDLDKMVLEFEKGTDMLIGWRKHRNDNFFFRTLPSIIANFIVRFFSKSKIHDHGCAFKIIKKNTIDELTNWGDFHRLLAARLANNGFYVKEIIVNHKNRILKVESFNSKLYVFFDNGKVLIIQSGEIINIIDLKVKNINLLYFQDDKLFVSLENGKTVLF